MLAKPIQVAAASYVHLMKANCTRVFAASLADIEKALAVKKETDPAPKLLRRFHKWLNVFKKVKTKTLPPLRGPGIDHRIERTRNNNRTTPEAPWGPLYAIS